MDPTRLQVQGQGRGVLVQAFRLVLRWFPGSRVTLKLLKTVCEARGRNSEEYYSGHKLQSIFDYHGVLDDHEDNFTQTSRKFIRELLNTSVFVEVLILSYIGVHGPHSQTRRESLQRQAFEFQRSLGRAGSRFGVHIVPFKRLYKAIVCRDTLPVLFCDDQKPLVDSCRPHCKLAEQIGPKIRWNSCCKGRGFENSPISHSNGVEGAYSGTHRVKKECHHHLWQQRLRGYSRTSACSL